MTDPFGLDITLPTRMQVQTARGILLDAAGERAGGVFTIPKTGLLKTVGWRTATVTTADDVGIRIETVDTSTSRPTGTLAYANATGTQVLVDTDDNKIFWTPINGSTGVNVTKGDIVALMFDIVYVNGSLTVVTGQTTFTGTGAGATAYPYTIEYTGGAWTSSVVCPAIALEYSDEIVVPLGCCMPEVPANINIGTGTSPTVIGSLIKMPFDCVCTGVWFIADLDANADVKLYDTNGSTVLASVSLASSVRGSTAVNLYDIQFSSPINLVKDAYYRVVLAPTTASTIGIYRAGLTNGATYTACSAINMGLNCVNTYADTVVNEASWTQDNTKRMKIGLRISEVKLGSKTGAGYMNGGFT